MRSHAIKEGQKPQFIMLESGNITLTRRDLELVKRVMGISPFSGVDEAPVGRDQLNPTFSSSLRDEANVMVMTPLIRSSDPNDQLPLKLGVILASSPNKREYVAIMFEGNDKGTVIQSEMPPPDDWRKLTPPIPPLGRAKLQPPQQYFDEVIARLMKGYSDMAAFGVNIETTPATSYDVEEKWTILGTTPWFCKNAADLPRSMVISLRSTSGIKDGIDPKIFSTHTVYKRKGNDLTLESGHYDLSFYEALRDLRERWIGMTIWLKGGNNIEAFVNLLEDENFSSPYWNPR